MSKKPQIVIKPEVETAATTATQRQDEIIESEYIMWRSYWLRRYLSLTWQDACASWILHQQPARPFRCAAALGSPSWTEQVRAVTDRYRPEAAWMIPVVERLRAKAPQSMLEAWYEKGGRRYVRGSPENQIEELAQKWEPHLERAGIVWSRQQIRERRNIAQFRPRANRPAPVDQDSRWAAAQATAEAIA